jgi:hypothetical protein
MKEVLQEADLPTKDYVKKTVEETVRVAVKQAILEADLATKEYVKETVQVVVKEAIQNADLPSKAYVKEEIGKAIKESEQRIVTEFKQHTGALIEAFKDEVKIGFEYLDDLPSRVEVLETDVVKLKQKARL